MELLDTYFLPLLFVDIFFLLVSPVCSEYIAMLSWVVLALAVLLSATHAAPQLTFGQLSMMADESCVPKKFTPLATPSYCFANYSGLPDPNTSSVLSLFSIDSIFFTLLVTVVCPDDSHNATNIINAIYERFAVQGDVEPLLQCLSPSLRFANMSRRGGPEGGFKAIATVPECFFPSSSSVYTNVMIAVLAASIGFIVVQLGFYLRFRRSSLYQRLEGHKRGGGLHRTWRQKLTSILFP